MKFSGVGILLDIEGTTSSVRYVYDTMFPFVRRELAAYLRIHSASSECVAACDQLAVEAGYTDWVAWAHASETSPAETVLARVLQLMDDDVKSTGLKALQGLIWKAGFASGELVAHVYADVPPALQAWHRLGLDLRIYSSGSVAAQRLFFGHTTQGSLLDLFQGHYDTTTGSKKSTDSYTRIAEAFGQAAEQLLFVSDIVAELDAAAAAGWRTALSRRPENPPIEVACSHPTIHSFAELEVTVTRDAPPR